MCGYISQLNEQKHFDDFDLCAITDERSAKASPKPRAEEVTLWPNPGSDKVSVQVPGLEAESRVHIRILDVSGRAVLEQIAATAADGMFALDVSRLAPGIYLCHIATDNRALIPVKLVISHQ
ncbi:MAG: T9SS C-terminal target domain-containing protein [Haliscomenobacteraceae bacterium CHB4]|nr:T9SS C-terminal target domain-containing protein [Haliscomenobacteraceae bacterium CHB4]